MRLTSPESPAGHRIVLTGGPGGGKSTAADLLRREFWDRVVAVPEAATLLFAGGFPRYSDPEGVKAAQIAILHVQKNLEDIQTSRHPDKVLLCDRGMVDGAVYWPGPASELFQQAGITLEAALKRYHAVLFFESAAVGGRSINGNNPVRNESIEAAAELDGRLRQVWSQHPRFYFIPHQASFLAKIKVGLDVFVRLLDELEAE
jgi:predicted ATPase